MVCSIDITMKTTRNTTKKNDGDSGYIVHVTTGIESVFKEVEYLLLPNALKMLSVPTTDEQMIMGNILVNFGLMWLSNLYGLIDIYMIIQLGSALLVLLSECGVIPREIGEWLTPSSLRNIVQE